MRRGLLAAAAVAIVYEIALNVFLLTGALGRALSDNPDRVVVEYASGWSIAPGFVHARRLRIRSRDSNIELELDVDRCAFHVSLFELLKRRFHVEGVRGEGVALRVRRRLEPRKATELAIEALPPIEGFERVPLKGPTTPPPDDAHYKLWTIALDRVDAESVREIWIDEVRFAGDAHVTGGFYLRPIRWVSVGPAEAEIRSGTVTTAKDVVASAVAGRASVTIDGFDPRSAPGAAIFRHVSAHVSLKGTIPSLAFVNRWTESPTVELRGGGGRAIVDAGLYDGRIAAASRLDLEADSATVDFGARSVTGDYRVAARVAGDGRADPLDASVEGRGLRAVERGYERAPLRAARAEVRLRSSQLDLADRPFSDAAVSARVPVVRVTDARLLNAWVPRGSGVRVEGGSGTAAFDVDLSGGVAHGSASLGLDGVRVARGDEPASGDLRLGIALRSMRLRDDAIDLSGSRLELLDVALPGARTAGWWANVALDSSDMDVKHGLYWRARVTASARDSRPFVSGVVTGSGLPGWIAPLAATNDLRATAEVRVAPRSIDVSHVAAAAGPLRLVGTWTKRGEATHALALVEAGALAVGVEAQPGGTHVQLVDAGGWFRQRVGAEQERAPR